MWMCFRIVSACLIRKSTSITRRQGAAHGAVSKNGPGGEGLA